MYVDIILKLRLTDCLTFEANKTNLLDTAARRCAVAQSVTVNATVVRSVIYRV